MKMFSSAVWSLVVALVFCFFVVHVEGMSFSGNEIKDRFLQSNNNDDNPYSYTKVPSELPTNRGKDLALLLALSRGRPSQIEAGPTMIFSKVDSAGQWMPPNYPGFYLPSGANHAEFLPMEKRSEGHSLSIVNPLDVLRQRMMLEMARRRMKENQAQIKANEIILKTLGKRSKDNCDEEGAKKSREADKDERRRTQRQDPYLDSHQDPDDFVV